MDRIKDGKCEVTGIPFDLNENSYDTIRNKYGPSVDKINPKLGYVKSNCRIVIWQFNQMKGEITDSEIFEICKKIVERGL